MLSTSSPPQRLLTTSAPPRHLSTSGDGKTRCGRRGRRRNVACGRGGTLYAAWNFCTWRLPDLYVAWTFLYVASRKTSRRIVLTTCMQRLYFFVRGVDFFVRGVAQICMWRGKFSTWRGFCYRPHATFRRRPHHVFPPHAARADCLSISSSHHTATL
jgi:hypothetical protein